MTSVKVYISGMVIAAFAAAFLLTDLSSLVLQPMILIVAAMLILLCALSRRFPVRFTRASIEVSDIAILAAIICLGPVWAIAVSVPDAIYRDRSRTIYTLSCNIVSILISSFVFQLFSGHVLPDLVFGADSVYGIVAAGATFYVLDAIFNAILLSLKYGTPVRDTFSDLVIPLIPSDILAILAALGTAYVMVAFGPAAALVLFLGCAGAIVSLHLIHTRQRENESLKAENAALLSANVRFVAALIESLGRKAPHVARISAASSVYAGDIGAEFGFDRARLDLLRTAALLQDIGLTVVPDGVILADANRLNAEGRRELERHTVIGEEILASVPGFEEAARWVRWHHERSDGSGYPDAMQGRWLPLEARILAVAETYASLVLESPGNPPISTEEARFELTAATDSTLDAEVVKALLRLLDREDADYAATSGERFSFGKRTEEMSERVPSLRIVGED